MTNPRGRACFGRSNVRVFGFVNEQEGLGGTSASGIGPAWLSEGGLVLYGSSHEANGDPGQRSYVVAVPPGFGNLQRTYGHRWVMLVAHFDDARARTCRGYGPKDANPPSRKEAVRTCRSILVLSSIWLTGQPDTATAGTGVRGGGFPERIMPTVILVLAAFLGTLSWPARRQSRRDPLGG